MFFFKKSFSIFKNVSPKKKKFKHDEQKGSKLNGAFLANFTVFYKSKKKEVNLFKKEGFILD